MSGADDDVLAVAEVEATPGTEPKKPVSELIEQLVDTGAAALEARCGLAAAEARELMRNVAHDVCVALGGGSIYIPKDLRFKLSKRDLQLFEDWRRGNGRDLAKKYGLTVARVYQIIAKVRAAEREKRQLGLPGIS